MSGAVIVGLGNPGREFARHRHNIGARCLLSLARLHGIALDQRLARCRVGRGEIAGVPVVLARPQTYMNLSGQAMASLLSRLGVGPADLLVLCDDLDLPLGKLRLRPGGSSGGHRGLESIIQALKTQELPRLRVGIGRPPGEGPEKEDEVVAHVLGSFSPAEEAALKGVLPRVAEAVACYLGEGLEAAMSRFN